MSDPFNIHPSAMAFSHFFERTVQYPLLLFQFVIYNVWQFILISSLKITKKLQNQKIAWVKQKKK